MIKEICKYSSSGVKSEYIVEGYADDLGGYCETVVTTDSGDKDSDLGIFGTKTTDKYREQFDSKGIATGWQFYNSDPAFGKVGWQDFDSDFDGNSDFTWSDTEYDDSFEDYETSFEDKTCATAKEYDYVVIARTTNPVNESPKSLISTGKLGTSTTTTTTTVPQASSVTISYEKIGTGNDGKIHWSAIDTTNVESMTAYWTYASSTSWSADGGNAFNTKKEVKFQ